MYDPYRIGAKRQNYYYQRKGQVLRKKTIRTYPITLDQVIASIPLLEKNGYYVSRDPPAPDPDPDPPAPDPDPPEEEEEDIPDPPAPDPDPEYAWRVINWISLLSPDPIGDIVTSLLYVNPPTPINLYEQTPYDTVKQYGIFTLSGTTIKVPGHLLIYQDTELTKNTYKPLFILIYNLDPIANRANNICPIASFWLQFSLSFTQAINDSDLDPEHLYLTFPLEDFFDTISDNLVEKFLEYDPNAYLISQAKPLNGASPSSMDLFNKIDTPIWHSFNQSQLLLGQPEQDNDLTIKQYDDGASTTYPYKISRYRRLSVKVYYTDKEPIDGSVDIAYTDLIFTPENYKSINIPA